MTDGACSSIGDSNASEQVAPLLPATANAPEPARRINFLTGLFLYWLLPGRLGPHLAVGSWRRAWAAHLISAILASSAVAYAAVTFDTEPGALPQQVSNHGLREALARQVLLSADQTTAAGWSNVLPLMALGFLPLAELGLVALAILAMPWCAGGDSTGSVFKRSLKNVYWATTLLIPGTLAYLAVCMLAPSFAIGRVRGIAEQMVLLATLVMTGVAVFLVARALAVGAGRYVGEPVGPAFAPREPLCERCGYRITGLPLTGRCPECGTPVRDSLPGGGRQLTAWQRCEFNARGIAELVRMQSQIIRRPDFFETVPVQQGVSSARHFWWGTFLLIVLTSLAFSRLVQIIIPIVLADPRYHGYDRSAEVLASLATLSVPIAGQTIMLFAACLWAQFRLGIRDYRVSATVCYYASPLMWPLMVVVLVSAIVASSRLGEGIASWPGTNIPGMLVTGPGLLGTIVGLSVIGAILFWWRRLCMGLRSVRYANA